MVYLSTEEIGVEDGAVTIDLHVEGEEEAANRVMMDLKDRAARLIQAERDRVPPEECDGAGWSMDWEHIFEISDDNE